MSDVRRPQQWFIQAAGRVWGPYAEARLQGFVAEGRVTAGTRVASHPEGPFAPARERIELDALFGAPRPEPAPSGPLRSMLVWAELASTGVEPFEDELSAYGAQVAIRHGLWFVQTRLEPAALRNALSRGLRGDDALLVVEAPLNRTAWFNLGGAAERHLRHIWGGGEA